MSQLFFFSLKGPLLKFIGTFCSWRLQVCLLAAVSVMGWSVPCEGLYFHIHIYFIMAFRESGTRPVVSCKLRVATAPCPTFWPRTALIRRPSAPSRASATPSAIRSWSPAPRSESFGRRTGARCSALKSSSWTRPASTLRLVRWLARLFLPSWVEQIWAFLWFSCG